MCGHENMSHLSTCDMCGNTKGAPRPDLQKPAPAPAAPQPQGSAWVCKTCGMQNGAADMFCTICGDKRP